MAAPDGRRYSRARVVRPNQDGREERDRRAAADRAHLADGLGRRVQSSSAVLSRSNTSMPRPVPSAAAHYSEREAFSGRRTRAALGLTRDLPRSSRFLRERVCADGHFRELRRCRESARQVGRAGRSYVKRPDVVNARDACGVRTGIIATLSIVEAREALGRVSKNATANSPHLVRGDDKIVYVLKPSGTDRQFANELLALALANLAELPIFDGALVTVPTQLWQNADAEFRARYAVGVHFGSRRPDQLHFDFWNVSPALIRAHIRNFGEFYTLTAFDELISNSDGGGNPGNLMAVQKHTDPRRTSFAIDHGHAFTGPAWLVEQLEGHVPVPVYPVLGVLRELLTARQALQDEAARMAGFVARFAETVEAARSGLSDRDRAAVVHLLGTRAPLMGGWIATKTYADHLPGLQ